MLKTILIGSVLLTAVATISFAQEKTNVDHEPYERPTAESGPINAKRTFPVILQNETIAPGVCRLHLDNGTKLEVSCNKTKTELI